MANKDKDLTTKEETAILQETRLMYPKEFRIDSADPIFKKRVKMEKAKKDLRKYEIQNFRKN